MRLDLRQQELRRQRFVFKLLLVIQLVLLHHISDVARQIWDRFYKTDLSRGKDKKGTGLGLSITREIIRAHGENINVISTEGEGSEFIFTLPLSDKNED